jgi:DNA-directed RNA polymerase subunit RPC12/RpoP
MRAARHEVDMPIAVIPKSADSVTCPACSRTLDNFARLGVRRQVDCQCGAKVIVDRREGERRARLPAQKGRRRA